jgi:hypothetical protein
MHRRENKLINNEIEKVYGRPRCRKKSIIKVDLREICCKCEGWIQYEIVMGSSELPGPQKMGNLLTSETYISSLRTSVHGGSGEMLGYQYAVLVTT